MDPMNLVRVGRSSARHLRTLLATQTLTPDDAKRLLDRIDLALEIALDERPAPELTLIAGGRR